MNTDVIIFLFIGLGVTATLYFLLKSTLVNSVQKAMQQLATVSQQTLRGEVERSEQDLKREKEVIGQLVSEMRRDLSRSQESMKSTDERQVASFSALKNELETYRGITQQLAASTEDLKKVLSNNQLRGQFGEQIAENLLKMAGFVVGQDYVFNKQQESVETRPDFTIFLPDKTKINVDAKFPYQALVRAFETDDKSERERHLKDFASDVRAKIKQVTTRDYINPEEKTVDFVILFIPNEMVFSVIYDQLNDVWEEAMQKKVIMAGPFSFTALLRMVKQAYSNFSYQENIHKIIGLVQKFEQEYEKYGQEFEKLGDKVRQINDQYDKLAKTRSSALTRIVDKIKNQQGDLPPSDEPNLLD